MGRRITELFYELRAKTEGLQSDLQGAERQLGKLSTFITNNPTASLLALGAAIGGIALRAEAMAVANERAFKRIATSLGEPRSALQGLRNDLRELSDASGVAQGDVIRLAGLIAKNGAGSAAGVRETTKATLELANATGDAADAIALGLDGVLDQFGILPERAEEAAASLYAFTKGKVPLQDLLDVLGRTSKAAQANKISFEVMAGAGAHLLDIGRTSKQAASQLEAFANGGAKGRASLEELAGQAPQTADAIAKLRKAAADNVAPMDAFKTTVDNLLESMAATGPAESFLGLLREITHVLQSGATGAGARLGDHLDNYDKILADRKKNPSFGTRNAPAAEASHVADDVAELSKIDGALAKVEGTRLTRARSAILEYKHLLTEGTEAYAKAQFAEEKIESELARRAATPATPLTGSGGTRKPLFDPEAEKAAAAAAEKVRAAAKAATDEIDRFNANLLKAVAGASDVAVDALANELRALQAEADKVGRETAGKGAGASINTTALEQRIAQLRVEIEAARQVAVADNVLKSVREQDVAAVKSTIADITAPLRDLATRAQSSSIGAALFTDEDENRLNEIAHTLTAIAGDASLVDLLPKEVRDRLKEALATIERTRAVLDRPAPPVVPADEKLTQRLRENTRLLQQGVDGALQLAHALGLAGDAVERLRAIGSVATNVPLLLREIHNVQGGLKGADGKALSSAFSVASAALPIAGGIASLVSSLGLFGHKEDPAEKARLEEARRQQQELVAALRDLQHTIGDINLNASAANRGRAVGAAQSARLGNLSGDPNNEGGSPAGQLGIELRKAGLSFAEFREQAKLLGITLPETIEEITRGMLDAVVEAAQSVSVRFDEMAKRWDVLGTSATEQLDELLAFIGERFPGAVGDIATHVREGFDLATQEGRDAAIAYVREQFRKAGSPIPPELAKKIIDGIAAIGDETAAAAQKAAQKIADAFHALADALDTIDLKRQIEDTAPADVIKAKIGAYADQVPDAFKEQFKHLLDGVDLDTVEGRATLGARIKAFFASMLADGKLDETEKQIAQGLSGILGDLTAFGDGIADERERARLKGIDAALGGADQASAFLDEDGPHAFARKAGAYGKLAPAFAELFAGLDLTTKEGAEQLDGRFKTLWERIAAGDKTLDTGKLTWEEFVDAAGNMESATDGLIASFVSAAGAIQTLSAKLQEVANDDRRLGKSEADTTSDQTAALANDPVLGGIIGGADLSTDAGRNAALTALRAEYAKHHDEQVGEAIDFLMGLPAVDGHAVVNGEFTPGASPASGRLGVEAQSLNQATGIRLADVMTGMYATERDHLASSLRIEDLLRQPTLRPLLPPRLDAYAAQLFGGGAASGGGSVSISANFYVTVASGDGSAPMSLPAAAKLERELAVLASLPESPLRRAILLAANQDYGVSKLAAGGRRR